ncbi:hypothetical protein COOONC_19726 [Cooperia oncophora]
MSSRQEVRTISPDDRVRLLDEFKRLRRVMGPRRFTIAMASSQLCDIVRRLDRALTPKSMPYWNARWDLRLPTPADSVLFSENFFSNTRVRREAKKKKSKDRIDIGPGGKLPLTTSPPPHQSVVLCLELDPSSRSYIFA